VKRDCITRKLADGQGVTINATVEDPDNYDLKICEIWSSIDGLLDRSSVSANNSSHMVSINPGKSRYLLSLSNLSEGHHTIILRVYDKDRDYDGETLNLDVNDYFLNIFPIEYSWVLIIGVIGAFLSALFLVKRFNLCIKRIEILILLFSFAVLYVGYYYYYYKYLSIYTVLELFGSLIVISGVLYILIRYSKGEIAQAWNSIGLAFYKRGRYDMAVKCFDKARKANPSY
jgi:tetratricopeptide (TPR) repeat protein